MHDTTETPSVVIIGAGFGGLAMALELIRAGIDHFVILEKGSGVGGVWRQNTYPGAACDIPSPLYSLSSVPNSAWPRRFSEQPDILAYLRRTYAEHDLTRRVRLHTEVSGAEFDEKTGRWLVDTVTGERLTPRVLISAVGQLSLPSTPELPGIERFHGRAFHSAEWDHDVELTGKRIAVIGTGASAIQFVPAIAPQAAYLSLFQRSAAWILPKPDVKYTPIHHTLFRRIPLTRLAERLVVWSIFEVISLGLVDLKPLTALFSTIARRHLHRQIVDADLRAKLTPDYTVGCKRGLFSNEYFPALARPNTGVVTDAIAEVTADGVRTADGTVHQADVIIFGTGFAASDFLAPMTVRGLGGTKLTDLWADGARAYLGMAVPDFPNLFLMYGPNTNLGAGSIVYMLECQARYITQLVRTLIDRPGTALVVRAEVEREYDAALQRRLGKSVWVRCSSWYRNAAGRITNNWPGTVSSYRLRTHKADLRDYRLLDASSTSS
ncbi:flavin-containing monooxygenase [Rhodococcus erythropolis]|uniref:flavin-containing monooxygenase n=1 Tax=Rhodococcus erythropolis TaxID=1833 RepID=UPI002036173E|nr:NAD(P)/FAD-dependent oxidoreductase [Rhodococcus erythropolis]